MDGILVKFCFVCLALSLLTCCRGSRKMRKPNILVLITDDQDVMLNSMSVMRHTNNRITQRGVEFTNAFTTTPMCCPSRSSILTGLYTHNHHVYTNNDNCSSVLWQRFYETKSYATYLNDAGYQTGYFGKYLNAYNGSHTPPGWQYWMGLTKNSKYYNYTLLHNGNREVHGDDYAEDYLTDLVTNRSMGFFRDSKAQDPEKPVLAVVSFPAPHGPEDGAPQYQNYYKNTTTHITASFDHVPNPDKHWIIRRVQNQMDSTQLHFSQLLQQKRLQTLRSVDDNIKKITDMLQEINELDNTFILYFSDHGYHIGQFGIPKGKSMPYDFDIRIPFMIRGPNIPHGARMQKIALNIDIAPTILGIAGVPIPPEMDGRNLLDLFDERKLESQPWRDSFLVERGKMPRDRAHLVKPKLEKKLERLRKICDSPNYANPCKAGQYWTCKEDESGKPRMQKCRPEKKQTKPRKKGNGNKKKKCPCPPSSNTAGGNDDISDDVLLRCGMGYKASGHGKKRVSKRNSYKPDRKRGGKSASRKNMWKRHKRDISEDFDVQSNARNSSNERKYKDNSMTLTPSCRLHMPNFEIRCSKNLYNNPREWVKHMGLLARSVKTLQIRMKYMKALRSCLNAYDQGIRKNMMCDCPAPEPRTPKPKLRSADNVTHPLTQIDDPEEDIFDEKLREYNEQRDKVRILKELRQAKLARIAKNTKRGTFRLKKCGSQGVTCFKLTNKTWTTEPKWDRGEECYCTNSNNNTYWCVRIINEHTDALYCQFITNFTEFYDLKIDPHQLYNNATGLSPEAHDVLHQKLAQLRGCKGVVNCTVKGSLKLQRSPSAADSGNVSNLSDVQDGRPQGDLNSLDPMMDQIPGLNKPRKGISDNHGRSHLSGRSHQRGRGKVRQTWGGKKHRKRPRRKRRQKIRALQRFLHKKSSVGKHQKKQHSKRHRNSQGVANGLTDRGTKRKRKRGQRKKGKKGHKSHKWEFF